VIRISFFFHNNYIFELSQETKKAKKGTGLPSGIRLHPMEAQELKGIKVVFHEDKA
jgi:hypothetical protein